MSYISDIVICLTLAAESCEDNIKNQDETDIDCGGTKCSKCNNTMACKANSDCISGFCNSENICAGECLMNKCESG